MKSSISEYRCTRHTSTNNHLCVVDFKKAFDSISDDKLWVTNYDGQSTLD